MNIDQIQSYVRSGLKIAGAFLLAHGMTNAAGVVNSSDFIGLCLTGAGLLWSHFFHAPPPPNSPGGPGRPGGVLMSFLALGLAGLMASGCASASKNAFSTELAAASTADAGMRSYATYWDAAYAAPDKFHRTPADLILERGKVEAISVKIGSSIALVETLRAAYATNSAIEPQLQAAVAALTQNTAAIVPFINTFLTVTN